MISLGEKEHVSARQGAALLPNLLQRLPNFPKGLLLNQKVVSIECSQHFTLAV